MLFNSIPFAIFALALLVVWHLLPKTASLRCLAIVSASLIFYGFHKETRIPSLLYIVVGGVSVYAIGFRVEKDKPGRKGWFLLGLAITVGGLSIFKYENIIALLFGQKLHLPMPLAVSFISFQLASYLIDIYRGQLQPCRSFLQFAAFVTFFPKLIAGPVVRGSVLLPQFAQPGNATPEQRWEGTRQFLIGLFKKNVIADNLGPMVNVAFAVAPAESSGYWWVMALLYTAQSYADFSGYSDMAIGMARILGFDLPPNFAHPFNSAGFREFWGRWHISVSTWFRDYLFFPLAKSWLPSASPKMRPLLTQAILWIVMIVSGVWHGVPAGYAIWGVLNAIYLSIEALYNWPARLSRTGVGRVAAALITVLLWSFSQIIFRATDLHAALEIVKIMFSFNTWDLSAIVPDVRRFKENIWPLLLLAVAVEHAWVAWRIKQKRAGDMPGLARLFDRIEPIGLALLVAASIFLRGPDAEFVYFKF